MARKRLFGSKGPLIYATIVSLICVMSASISTFAWFQVKSSADAGTVAQTKALKTNATVYQNNDHDYDDAYQTDPTNDKGGTLSYDHAKGGKATNYYIRQWEGNTEKDSLQMFTNESNTYDKAVYYNVHLNYNWKVYDAASNTYYGFNALDSSCPVYSSNLDDGTNDHNIKASALTSYYDIYFTGSSRIWITEHGERTTSDQMGNETGYYIYGTPHSASSALTGHTDIKSGIPMYVNAGAGSSDYAFYAGLRLEVGDICYVASGESTTTYKVADSAGNNLLNGARFDFTPATGAITCNDLGYYNIALNASGNLFVEEWDGKEVDGTTYYKDGSGNPLGRKNARSAAPVPKKKGNIDGTTVYLYTGSLTGWESDGAKFAICVQDSNGGNSTWAALSAVSGKSNLYSGTVPSSNSITWGKLCFCRMSSNALNWDARWNEIVFTSWDTYNLCCKVTGWGSGVSSVGSMVAYWPSLSSGHDYLVGTNGYISGKTAWNMSTGATQEDASPGDGNNAAWRNVTVPKNAEMRVVYYTEYSALSWTTFTVNNNSYAQKSGDNLKFDKADREGKYSIYLNSSNVFYIDCHNYTTYTLSTKYEKLDGTTEDFTCSLAGSKTYNTSVTLSTPSSSEISALQGLDDTIGTFSHWEDTSGNTITSVTMSTDKTVVAIFNFAVWTVTYEISVAGAPKAYDSISVTRGNSVTLPTPTADSDYEFDSSHRKWFTNPNGTEAAGNFGASYTPTSDITLYAYETPITYTIYMYDWGTGSGSTHTLGSVTYNIGDTSKTITASIGKDFKFKFYATKPNAYFPSTGHGVTSGGAAITSGFIQAPANVNDNYNCVMGGTYTVTLTISAGSITAVSFASPSAYNSENFGFYEADSDNDDSLTAKGSWSPSSHASTFSLGTIHFVVDKQYFIQGPTTSWGWGYNNIDSDHQYLFVEGGYDADFDNQETANAAKARISFAASVTFNFSSNTITLSSVVVESTYGVRENNGSGGYATLTPTSTSISGVTITFTGTTLTTNRDWYVYRDNVETGHSTWANMPSTVTALGVDSISKETYFYQRSDTGSNICTGYGGTYTIQVNAVTGAISSINCTAFAQSDFEIITNKGSATLDAFDAISNNSSTHAATLTKSSMHLYIGETLYVQNNNGGTTLGGVSCRRTYENSGSDTVDLGSSGLLTFDGNRLKARVDVTISFSFVYHAEDTSGALTITACTENRSISFNHARDAGIYVEIADNTSFTNSTVKMMHTTSGLDSGGNQYLAQESPINTTGGSSTQYMRIFQTHSNTNGSVPSGEAQIRAATEYYYVVQDTKRSGFDDGNLPSYTWVDNSDHSKGVASGAYVTVTVTGSWTISLRSDGCIHIEEYGGAATVSIEHEVPYYLIGRGMPGSALRNSDFTIGKGTKLWTYGGNSGMTPCYVGEYEGDNTDSSKVKGTGIALKAGDVFALSSPSTLVLEYSSSTPSTSDFTINGDSTVTVHTSGTYLIYIDSNTEVHVEKSAAGSGDWTRGSDDVVAKNQSGVSLVASTGNTLTFGGNLDYSLLDACADGGYSFVVYLEHSSSVSGTVNYTLTNGNTDYSISVGKYDGTYSSSNAYTNTTSIASESSNTSFSLGVTGGTPARRCFKITIPAAEIKSMIASGSYSFSMTISYSFTETLSAS